MRLQAGHSGAPSVPSEDVHQKAAGRAAADGLTADASSCSRSPAGSASLGVFTRPAAGSASSGQLVRLEPSASAVRTAAASRSERSPSEPQPPSRGAPNTIGVPIPASACSRSEDERGSAAGTGDVRLLAVPPDGSRGSLSLHSGASSSRRSTTASASDPDDHLAGTGCSHSSKHSPGGSTRSHGSRSVGSGDSSGSRSSRGSFCSRRSRASESGISAADTFVLSATTSASASPRGSPHGSAGILSRPSSPKAASLPAPDIASASAAVLDLQCSTDSASSAGIRMLRILQAPSANSGAAADQRSSPGMRVRMDANSRTAAAATSLLPEATFLQPPAAASAETAAPAAVGVRYLVTAAQAERPQADSQQPPLPPSSSAAHAGASLSGSPQYARSVTSSSSWMAGAADGSPSRSAAPAEVPAAPEAASPTAVSPVEMRSPMPACVNSLHVASEACSEPAPLPASVLARGTDSRLSAAAPASRAPSTAAGSTISAEALSPFSSPAGSAALAASMGSLAGSFSSSSPANADGHMRGDSPLASPEHPAALSGIKARVDSPASGGLTDLPELPDAAAQVWDIAAAPQPTHFTGSECGAGEYFCSISEHSSSAGPEAATILFPTCAGAAHAIRPGASLNLLHWMHRQHACLHLSYVSLPSIDWHSMHHDTAWSFHSV